MCKTIVLMASFLEVKEDEGLQEVPGENAQAQILRRFPGTFRAVSFRKRQSQMAFHGFHRWMRRRAVHFRDHAFSNCSSTWFHPFDQFY